MAKMTTNIVREGAQIVFKNFSGAEGNFNREGDRSFTMVIPTEEEANELANMGWNIKARESKAKDDTNETGLWYGLKVKVKFNEQGPRVAMMVSDKLTYLDEVTVGQLDTLPISKVDICIRPYNYIVNGKEGVAAYLQSLIAYVDESQMDPIVAKMQGMI